MLDLPTSHRDCLIETLVDALQTPSPTGHTQSAIHQGRGQIEVLGLSSTITPEGTLVSTLDGVAVGEGREADEQHVRIGEKGRGGPYHHAFGQALRRPAQPRQIPFWVDGIPFHGSDGEGCWRARGEVRVALMGAGAEASHKVARTHSDALIATTQLICAYLIS